MSKGDTCALIRIDNATEKNIREMSRALARGALAAGTSLQSKVDGIVSACADSKKSIGKAVKFSTDNEMLNRNVYSISEAKKLFGGYYGQSINST